jgi:hypothetical protein
MAGKKKAGVVAKLEGMAKGLTAAAKSAKPDAPKAVKKGAVVAAPKEKPATKAHLHAEVKAEPKAEAPIGVPLESLQPTGLPTAHAQHPAYDHLAGERPEGFLGVRPEPPRA